MLSASVHGIKSQDIYKLRGYIPAASHDIDTVFQAVVTAILEYCSKDCIKKSKEEAFAPAAWEFKDFEAQDKNYFAECRSIPEIHIWTLRLKFIQEEKHDERISEFRNWHYDFSLMRERNGFEFGWEVRADEIENVAPPVFSARLAIVLAEKAGLSQARVLNGRHMVVRDIVDAENLYNLLSFPGRQLPVVVISQVNSRSWEFTPNPPLYLIDAANFAMKTAGLAHVVQLTFEGSYEWSQLTGQAWSVYDGAIRIFRPRFDINHSLTSEHPLFFKDLIWEQHGVKEFYSYLMDYIRRIVVSGFFGWENMVFLPTVKSMKDALARIRFVDEDVTPAEYYEKRISRLSADLQREKRKSEKLVQENHALKEKNLHLEGLTASYERTINQMNGYKESIPPEIRPEEIDIPSSFKNMPDWVEVYLERRLILHPRAIGALSKTRCKFPELVYKALVMLAFQYRDFRLGRSSEKKFKTKCSELGLRQRATVSKNRLASEGEPYFVNYPYHSAEKQLLEFALVKGNSRQASTSVRIYFFWDDASQEVIVGHLPSPISNKIN